MEMDGGEDGGRGGGRGGGGGGRESESGAVRAARDDELRLGDLLYVTITLSQAGSGPETDRGGSRGASGKEGTPMERSRRQHDKHEQVSLTKFSYKSLPIKKLEGKSLKMAKLIYPPSIESNI